MKGILATVPVLLVAMAPAQDPLHGNGVPAAYIDCSPGVLGGNITARFGSPQTPGGLAVVSISGGFGPFSFASVLAELGPNPIAMDPFDPAYQVLFFGLDGNGDGSVTVPTPPFFAAASPPLFLDTVTLDSPTQWSVSKTARLDWMAPGAWEAVAPMGAPRQLHTATFLGADPRDNDTDVLICGGATGSFVTPIPTATAELFSPVTRATTPLPSMALPRSGHTAVRLNNGFVLIAGGVTTGGAVTASCEFYLPAARTFLPAPPMNAPRAGHAMTLLGDGRVLVSGGVSDWQNAAANFIAALNTAQDTAEIFDPTTSTWQLLPVMPTKRLGHSQTMLLNGRVLITSGINGGYAGPYGGGQVPTYTTNCVLFDPVTNSFASTGSMVHVDPYYGFSYNGRAYHGATLMPNGSVLITGGLVAGPTSGNEMSILQAACDIWNPATGVWSYCPDLPSAVAFHQQLASGSGALVTGGFTTPLESLAPSTQVVLHDGVTVTTLAPMSNARGGHSMTRLADGTFLIYGGGQWPSTISDGAVYLRN